MRDTALIPAALLALALPVAAAAEALRTETTGSVAQTMEAVRDAIGKSGAEVVATVDHGAAARAVGSDIGESQLVIFGNPEVGTPAMAANRLAGLRLPLKILVYADADGQTWIAYDDPAMLFTDLEGIPASAEHVARMSLALQKIVDAAKK